MNKDRIKVLIDKYLVDYVYNAARIEGVNTKYLDTKLLVDENIEPNLDADKIIILKNLKDAYKALKDDEFLQKPIDVLTMNDVNRIINGRGLVHSAGQFRTEEVYITNCKYVPPMPGPYYVNSDILDIIQKEGDPLEKGIELYLYIMRTQPYIDGNKRTANVFANLYLLQNDCPIISVHADKKRQFLLELSKFYETNDRSKITKLIKEHGLYDIKNI